MGLRKLGFVTILATIFAFVAVERLNVPIKGFGVATPNSRPHDAALPPDGSLWHMGQPANEPGRSNWVKAFHTKNEIQPPVFLPVLS